MIADLLRKALSAPTISVMRGRFKLKAIQDDVKEECEKRLISDSLSRVCTSTAIPITGKVRTHLNGCFCDNVTDRKKRDDHHVVPDERHVNVT